MEHMKQWMLCLHKTRCLIVICLHCVSKRIAADCCWWCSLQNRRLIEVKSFLSFSSTGTLMADDRHTEGRFETGRSFHGGCRGMSGVGWVGTAWTQFSTSNSFLQAGTAVLVLVAWWTVWHQAPLSAALVLECQAPTPQTLRAFFSVSL